MAQPSSNQLTYSTVAGQLTFGTNNSSGGPISLNTAQALSGTATKFLARVAEENPAAAPAALVSAQVSFQLAAAKYISDIQAGGDPTSLAFFKQAYIDSASLVSAGFTVAAAGTSLLGPEAAEAATVFNAASTALDLTVNATKAAQTAGANANPEYAGPNATLEKSLEEQLDQVNNVIDATSGSPITKTGALESTILSMLKPSDEALASYAESGKLPSNAGQTADPLLTTNQDLTPSLTTAYGDSGAPQQNLTETVNGNTGTITGFSGEFTSLTTNLAPQAGVTATDTANLTNGTSVTFAQNNDGSSLSTQYTGPNGTGSVTGRDQENADGLQTLPFSMLTAMLLPSLSAGRTAPRHLVRSL